MGVSQGMRGLGGWGEVGSCNRTRLIINTIFCPQVFFSWPFVTDIPLAETRCSASGRGLIDSFPNSLQVAAFIPWFLILSMMGFSEGDKTVCRGSPQISNR